MASTVTPPIPARPTAADVSVVVCAYTMERWSQLRAAVGSLLNQEHAVGEIVLVIDHQDELLAAARREWPQLVVVANAGERGLSGARDTGVARCHGEIVAFLDDDACAGPDWSRRLAAAYERADVIGVGGHVAAAWAGGRPTWWPPEFDWVVGCSYRGLPAASTAVRNVIGANMSLRREVLERVGGFDSRLGRVGAAVTGCEETELYIRSRRAFPGTEVVYDPAVKVRHHVPESRATWRYFMRRCYGEGVSKQRVARLTTRQEALSSEKRYVLRTLPVGVVTGLLGRDPRRGIAVVLGVGCTALGYARAAVADVARAPRRGSGGRAARPAPTRDATAGKVAAGQEGSS